MKILGIKPGHDGSIVFIDDNNLIFSLEAEKNSFPRYSDVSAQLIAQALEMAPSMPDILAIGGWHKQLPITYSNIAVGYYGLENINVREGCFLGEPIKIFSSSHERSHIFMATAMAPSAPIKECIVLVWEGVFGNFYHWREYGKIISRVNVLSEPGARYAALFAIADPNFPDYSVGPNSYPGKLMALSGYAQNEPISKNTRLVVESLLTAESLYPFKKSVYRETELYNCGVHTPKIHNAARYISNQLFQIFYEKAKYLLPQGLPLIISGGCGLNCEWNRYWQECGLFSEVFVPPCANDSGSAIGTAVDAMVYFGKSCQLNWTVYSGAPFIHNTDALSSGWMYRPLDIELIAHNLAQGDIIAWVQGRCEIGPRALGHRSLLASPLLKENKDILNEIKEREEYRPIAPCCLAEDIDQLFEPAIDDPYMLYFSKVKTSALPAITHVDGTARVQSVRSEIEPTLHDLLKAFKSITGYGVLCNTSLNFSGMGFINCTSELLTYCEHKRIKHIVIDNSWYIAPK
jgi:hydroxymethyl cephem carbamoyltransferase